METEIGYQYHSLPDYDKKRLAHKSYRNVGYADHYDGQFDVWEKKIILPDGRVVVKNHYLGLLDNDKQKIKIRVYENMDSYKYD